MKLFSLKARLFDGKGLFRRGRRPPQEVEARGTFRRRRFRRAQLQQQPLPPPAPSPPQTSIKAPDSPDTATSTFEEKPVTEDSIPEAPTAPSEQPPPLQQAQSTSQPSTRTLDIAATATPTTEDEPVTEETVAEESITPIEQLPPPPQQLSPAAMAEQELHSLIPQLRQSLSSHRADACASLLSRAKAALLQLNALTPTPDTPAAHLRAARETLELGALASIRLQDPAAFTRYFQQLQAFYGLPAARLGGAGAGGSAEGKITGLYLLLLLSQGDYAAFHSLLETLELAAAQEAREQEAEMAAGNGLEDNAFIQYPIRLEQALMEGSYDRVWGETKGERVPSEEFSVFSEVLIGTIRSEIASCSERAYASVPISNAKNLFFLDSEGSVVQFAQQRGWSVRDGRIYFPQQEADLMGTEKDILVTSGQVIENTLGYARELETIV